MWLEHLKTVTSNRKRGAEKGAKTRRDKIKRKDESIQLESELYYCGICNGAYQEETEHVEKWIGCDKCEAWFHWSCVNICEKPLKYLCNNCNV